MLRVGHLQRNINIAAAFLFSSLYFFYPSFYFVELALHAIFLINTTFDKSLLEFGLQCSAPKIAMILSLHLNRIFLNMHQHDFKISS